MKTELAFHERIDYYIAETSICALLPNKQSAKRFVQKYGNAISMNLVGSDCECFVVRCADSGKNYEIHPNTTLNKGTTMIRGKIDQEWLRIAEEIYQSKNPMFLVDMELMQNVMVNEQACTMMDCSSEELLKRKLTMLWVPPGKIEPIDYDKCLPPHLQEFHNLLRCQSRLENHRFRGWHPAGDNTSAHWVEYVDNIRLLELSGRFYRLMECLDEPKIITA